MYHSLRNRLGVGEMVLAIYTKDRCCTNVVWPPQCRTLNICTKYPPVNSLYFAIHLQVKMPKQALSQSFK